MIQMPNKNESDSACVFCGDSGGGKGIEDHPLGISPWLIIRYLFSHGMVRVCVCVCVLLK